MMKYSLVIVAVLAWVGLALPTTAAAPLVIVAATPDLALLASEIGGNDVKVSSLIQGEKDLHSIEPKPSMVAKIQHADLVIRVGMDLDAWFDGLIETARNPRVLFGSKGYLDLSTSIQKIEVPSHQVDGSHGDIHIYGNPHYWLDPNNSELMAQAIAARIKLLKPDSAKNVDQALADFDAKFKAKSGVWSQRMAPFQHMKILTYHRSWSYFVKRYSIQVVDTIETKPGIPPTPGHLLQLQTLLKTKEVKWVMMESFFDTGAAAELTQATHIPLIIVPSSVGALNHPTSFLDLFDDITLKLSEMKKG